MSSRFYVPGELTQGTEAALSPEESHHLSRVLRLEPGSKIDLMNGAGNVASATVVTNSPKKSVVRIEKVHSLPRSAKVCLAFAISKGQALDFIIHRCTELGVSAFQPLVTQHSLNKDHWNEERWKKVVIEVSKQCQAHYLASLHPPKKLGIWLAERGNVRPLVYCDEKERGAQLEIPTNEAGEVDLVVGGEGGWSESEVSDFREQPNSYSLGLGQNRLRTETASLVALTLLKSKLNEI